MFCRTKRGANRVGEDLDIAAFAPASSTATRARAPEPRLDDFKAGR